MATLIDSYSESNQNRDFTVNSGNPFAYQSYTASGDFLLASAKFYLKKSGTPTGNGYAKLYSHSGSYGSSSSPGTLLATSDAFDVSTLSTSFGLVEFTFSGAEKVVQVDGTYYVIMFYYNGGDGANIVSVGADDDSPSHDGNAGTSGGGAYSNTDLCFYVYGDPLFTQTCTEVVTATDSLIRSNIGKLCSEVVSMVPNLIKDISKLRTETLYLTENPLPSAIPTANLRARWLFENNRNDSSGNGYTLSGNNDYTTGKSNQGARSSSSSVYMNIASALGISGTDAFSTSMWVYLGVQPSNNGYCTFFYRQNADPNSSNDWFRYHNYSGVYSLRFTRGGVAAMVYNVTLPLNEWIHLATTYSPTTGFIVYLNGNPVMRSANTGVYGTNSNALDLFEENLYAGARRLDEMRVYKSTLTAGEVAGLYSEFGNVWTPALTKLTSHPMSEAFSIVENMVSRAGKMMVEAIVITATALKEAARNLFEIINITSFLDKASQRLLTESVTVVDSLIGIFGKTFGEVIEIISSTVNASGKLLSEVVTIVSGLFNNISRIFGETINIVTDFVAPITRMFVESISITDSIIKALLGRVFDESVLISDSIKREVGKLLSEVINLGIAFVAMTQRIFSEAMTVTDSFTRSAGRIFMEIVTMTTSFIAGTILVFSETITITADKFFGHMRILAETITTIPEMLSSAGKILIETIAVIGTLIPVFAKMFVETISIIGERVIDVSRSLLESISMTASAVIETGRSFAETIIVTVSTTFMRVTVRVITEAISIADQCRKFLNGIFQTGWRSIQRIKGIWRDISRHDN